MSTGVDAEHAVLGTMLSAPQSAAVAFTLLDADQFFHERNKEIFRSAEMLFSAGVHCDLVSVVSNLAERNKLAQVTASYVSELASMIPMVSSLPHHCRIVRDQCKSRKAVELSQRVISWCNSGAKIEEVIDEFNRGFVGMMQDKSASAEHVGDIAEVEVARIEAMQERGHVSGLSTGFADIDFRLVGMEKQDLIILAARPSMGKTCLAMNIACNVAEKGNKVMVFSVEMGTASLTRRLLSAYSDVSSEAMRRGCLDSGSWNRLKTSKNRLRLLPLHIDGTPSLTITEMQARAKLEHLKGTLDFVVVDYLQLLYAKAENRTQEISSISRGLKALAKDLDCPVLALSQLSRSLESRTDKRPQLSDLRESGAIEQDADVVMFIYRDEVYNKAEENPMRGIAEIITAKQRNGPTGTDQLLFQGEFSRFKSLRAD